MHFYPDRNVALAIIVNKESSDSVRECLFNDLGNAVGMHFWLKLFMEVSSPLRALEQTWDVGSPESSAGIDGSWTQVGGNDQSVRSANGVQRSNAILSIETRSRGDCELTVVGIVIRVDISGGNLKAKNVYHG